MPETPTAPVQNRNMAGVEQQQHSHAHANQQLTAVCTGSGQAHVTSTALHMLLPEYHMPTYMFTCFLQHCKISKGDTNGLSSCWHMQ